MGKYIIRRMLLMPPTLLIVTTVVFMLMHLIPGDAVIARLEEVGVVTDETIEAVREKLGLNRPLMVQYYTWLFDTVRGDFGISLWTQEPVTDLLIPAIPPSIEIVLGGAIVAFVLAIPLGVISAIKQDTPIDYTARLASILGFSVPDFWIAIMLILFVSLQFQYFPPLGYQHIWDAPWDNIQMFFMPCGVLSLRLIGTSARMTRATMLEVMKQDYIRTARAKGLAERSVVYRHALRNALIPVVTIMGTQVPSIIGGLVILESLFGIPGLGDLVLTSVLNRDYPTLQTGALFIGAIIVFSNLGVDLLYSWLDPRIRYA